VSDPGYTDLPHRVRDPLYGFIRFSDPERELINWTAFQRLRNIKQLALTCHVYPGAMHTRFEHSLGTMELATRAFMALCRKQEQQEQLKTCFSRLCLTLADALRILRFAALLHDVGHLPFSHAAERLGDGACASEGHADDAENMHLSHEELGFELLQEHEVDILKMGHSKEFFRAATSILEPDPASLPPELRVLKQLLSNQLDVDRTDYLLRDSLHCGVQYGNFDCDRLLDSLVTIASDEGGLELAIDRGGVHVLESLILARYSMFIQVYLHRTRRIYDKYLADYLAARYGTSSDSARSLVHLDDIDVIRDMRDSLAERSPDSPLYEAAYAIVNRKHHSMVHETTPHPDARELRIANDIARGLKDEFGEELIVVDDACGYVHSFYVRRAEGDEKASQEFMVVLPREKRKAFLCDEAKIIETIPRRMLIRRIYCGGDAQERCRVKKRADELRAREL